VAIATRPNAHPDILPELRTRRGHRGSTAPDLFDPTRFLPGRSNTIERYTYLPFGVGPRVCIGAALAVQEANLVVATLMRHFVLDLVPSQSVWPVIDFTMKPRDGLRMTVTSHRSRRHHKTLRLRCAAAAFFGRPSELETPLEESPGRLQSEPARESGKVAEPSSLLVEPQPLAAA